jgi:hypothetical protein
MGNIEHRAIEDETARDEKQHSSKGMEDHIYLHKPSGEYVHHVFFCLLFHGV